MPRKIPKRPLRAAVADKTDRMRGENCVEASVSVISRIANTIDTTVMIDVAMTLRMVWATLGSCARETEPGIQCRTPAAFLQGR